MKFLIDANLPIRLARWLEGQGHDARHVAELPDGYETVDRLVWDVADAEERVVISKDVDFRDRQILTGSPKRLLRLRVGNISNADLAGRLLPDRVDNLLIRRLGSDVASGRIAGVRPSNSTTKCYM